MISLAWTTSRRVHWLYGEGLCSSLLTASFTVPEPSTTILPFTLTSVQPESTTGIWGKPFPTLDEMPCSTLPCPDLHETWKTMVWGSSASIIIKITYIRPAFQSDACPSCNYQASEMNRPWQYNERFLWSEKHLTQCKWRGRGIHLYCYLLMWRNIPMVWTQGPTRASEWRDLRSLVFLKHEAQLSVMTLHVHSSIHKAIVLDTELISNWVWES